MLHAAKLARSERLQSLLAYLTMQGEHGATTRDIVMNANVMAVSTAVSELRANGHSVFCLREDGHFRYFLSDRLHQARAQA
jgi:hypothetical protein